MSERSPPCCVAKRESGLHSVIKSGARTLTAAGCVLALLGAKAALAHLQIDQTVDKSGPWTIGYNSALKGCVASATADDGTTIWIGFEGSGPETPAYLAFTNPNWRSIEARKFYDLEIQAAGSYRWRGYSSGVERPNERGLFVFGVKRRAIDGLAQTSALVLSINKEQLTQTNISGVSDAIEKLKYCQEHRLAALKNPVTKNARAPAETPKQPERETAEPAPLPIPVIATPETLLARLDGEKIGPDAQPIPAHSEAQAPAQTIEAVDQAAKPEGDTPKQVARAPDTGEQDISTAPAQQPAALSSPVEQATTQAELNREALVRAIKHELKRVGCYKGPIDNDWQAAPARVSMQKFSRLAGIPLTEPTNALLDAIKVRAERVCPPEPVAYPIRRNVRHVARKCPGGFERDEDGDCPRRKAASRHDIDDEDRPRARSHEGRRRGRVYADQRGGGRN